MRPRCSSSESVHSGMAHAKAFAYCKTGFRRGKYFVSHFLGQFGKIVSVAFQTSTFANHVCRVVAVRAKEQMARIAAARHIASVKDFHSKRNLAVVGFPCEPVSIDLSVVNAGPCVSGLSSRSEPKPATALCNTLDAVFDVLLSRCKHGTSNKGYEPVACIGHAGPLSLFPVVQL